MRKIVEHTKPKSYLIGSSAIYNQKGTRLVCIAALTVLLLSISFVDVESVDADKSGVCGENLTWEFIEATGELRISGFGPMTDFANVGWVDFKTEIKSLSLSKEITYIGNSAFYEMPNLTGNLVLPEKLTAIGRGAFYNCSGITGTLELPSNLTEIGIQAFYGCSGFTGNLDIPKSVVSIGNHAFRDCTGFTGNLIIPDNVKEIGNSAFENCNGFDGTLSISKGVTSLGNNAFRDCNKLNGSLIIPENIENIGNGAFQNCTGFTGEIKIPEKTTKVGSFAFKGCTGFTGSPKLSNNITEIGGGAFEGCSNLSGILVLPNKLTTIGGYAFKGCTGFEGVLIIPDSVSIVGPHSFINCTGFTGISMSENVSIIDIDAFYGCTGIKGSLVIPNSVVKIGTGAFYGCTGITDITISPGASGIDPDAFPSHRFYKENGTTEISTNEDGFVGYRYLGSDAMKMIQHTKLISHHVTYDANGGDISPPIQNDVNEGWKFTVAPYAGIKKGYTFEGWSWGNNEYQPNQKMMMGKTDIILTAIWIENKHHVTYDTNGGSEEAPIQDDVPENTSFIIKEYGGTKTNSKFTGWSWENITYQPRDVIMMGNSDIILTANWESVDEDSTMIFIGIAGILVLAAIAVIILVLRHR